MKQAFRIVSVMVAAVLLMVCVGCTPDAPQSDGKLKIVTTIFPPYDFAKAVTGDCAEVSMLLKPGTESHSYEPSPADIILVESCDIFIYNGGESDVWVESLLSTLDTSKVRVLKMMDCVEALEEETVEGMHTLGHNHNHEEDEHHHEEDFQPDTAEYDEHIWTSPQNAIQITKKIAETVISADEAHAETYRSRTESYIASLQELDAAFREAVSGGCRRTVIFGDRFPFRYLAQEYGLTYRAAFPGCSAESEPGAKTVAYLIDKVREEQIPNIFYIEFSNQKIANTIQEETGAVPLRFHSCHNLSKDEMERGETYLSLMTQNAENLKEALQSCP